MFVRLLERKLRLKLRAGFQVRISQHFVHITFDFRLVML